MAVKIVVEGEDSNDTKTRIRENELITEMELVSLAMTMFKEIESHYMVMAD